MNQTRSKIILSLFWKFLERIGTQGIQFVMLIVLARLLVPEQYGIIAIVNVFIMFANVFVQSGLNIALIQKKDADEVDFSSVFYLSLIIATILYVILFISSPFIAEFYNDLQLVSVLRVLAFTLFLGAFNSIQNAYIAKKMMFKKLFYSSLWAILISGVVGIGLAYYDYGVWSLVVQQLLNQSLITIILWFTVRWRPKLLFSIERLRVLFSFGWKLLASYILNILYTDMRTLVIGKIFNASTLGHYNRGKQFPELIINNIDGSIQSVMMPALSSYQDDLTRVKYLVKKSISMSSFIVLPIMTGLAVIAEPMVRIVLTDKWISAVPFIQIYCVILSLRPVHTANVQAINSLGRSDIFLKIEIIRTITGFLVLWVSLPFGVFAIAIGELFMTISSSFLYSFPNKKLIGYSFRDQIKDVLPFFLISLIMGLCVYLINYLNIPTWIMLIIQIILGIIIYFSLAILFKLQLFTDLKLIINELIKGSNLKK